MRALHAVMVSLAAVGAATQGHAESAAVAVASNFYAPMQALEQQFETETGHEVSLISGSTGGLYAQIVNGAPYDVFIAADALRPALLAESGLGLEGSRTTIAVGRLVLWTRHPSLLDRLDIDVLRDGSIRFLAIAHPELAPYGRAAQQTLEAMGIREAWSGRLAYGANVAQAYAMTSTGNAELGLVAHSQMSNGPDAGAYVAIPQELYEPIRQDGILLARGVGNRAATELIDYLSAPQARSVIRRFGYGVPD